MILGCDVSDNAILQLLNKAISYATYKGNVVAAAGLRKTRAAERAELFKRTETTSDPKAFKIQLDWLYLHPDHRNKGPINETRYGGAHVSEGSAVACSC